jgi:peptide-methionine (R)-S-oxide reductase
MLSDQHQNEIPSTIGRRTFFGLVTAAAAALAWSYFQRRQPVQAAATAAASFAPPKMVKIVLFTDAGQRQDTVTVPKIVKSADEWRKQLSPDSFEVTRSAETERPYTNEDPNAHAQGVFRCICCDTALFDARNKFESGTGWPSFWAPIAKENILESSDISLAMIRTAVSCRLCDAHLGHVFDDGPRPTGLRYCMNSIAMRFAKAGS